MGKFYTLIFVLLFLACSDEKEVTLERYVEDVFSEVIVTSNIQYGSNKNLLNRELDLFIDIYQPKDDKNELRPTLLLAHGGAFVSGKKEDIEDLCIAYAKKGYVAVSMSYRLIDVGLIASQVINDSIGFSEGVLMTMQDMKAAIRYLRNDAANANNFGIDPAKIFIGGVSAGAVMACNVGLLSTSDHIPDYLEQLFIDNGGIEGDTNDLIESSSDIAGIISFSGSVLVNSWMTKEDPPIFLVHEEFDSVVPCGYESTDLFPFEIFAYGSCEMQLKAQEVGLPHEFIFFEGDNNHVGYFIQGTEEDMQNLVDLTADFIASHL